ncbi:hypothetical protein Q1695_008346 [Nippostrongylus brasiliensis]|nr:hypothetical protein Q1695_008346 [Nippostrongylus brasiliensis]
MSNLQQGASVPHFVGATKIMAPQHQLQQDVTVAVTELTDFICSDKTQESVRKEVLNKFNEIRTTVAKGDAESLNGAIPAAGNMYKLIYDCDLEEMATLMISGCPARKPTITRAFNLAWLAKDKTTKDAVETWEESLSTNPVKWPKNNILPDPATIDYYPYATMVNFNATAVGCANEYCKYDAQNEKAVIACVFDVPALAQGSPIYATGRACSDCTVYTPSTCDNGGFLCMRTEPTTAEPTTEAPTTEAPTTEAPTTEAPTTEAPTTEAPTTEAATTEAPTTEAPTTEAPTTEAPTTEAPTTEAPTTEAPTTEAPTTEAPTTAAPATAAPTTAAPTTAAQPTAAPTTAAPATAAPTTMGTGGTTGCSPDQSDQLRQKVVDMINQRRDNLARGNVAKNNGALLPTAANMLKINYSCALEGEALTYAKTCPGSGSSQEGKSENFYNGSASDMVQAADKATRNWWKQVRLVDGIGVKKVLFRQKHMNSPIRFFTLMAWATVNEIGCGVAQCGSVYNVVCRYNPPGNIVGSPVYEIGPPTFQCPPGTQPDARYTGLCA